MRRSPPVVRRASTSASMSLHPYVANPVELRDVSPEVIMLRPPRIEAARLARRTAHHENTRRNADHLRAIGTFAKFAIFPLLRVAQTWCDQRQHGKEDSGTAD
jgi:hypothetical protein